LATRVRHDAARLEQEEAIIRSGGEEPPAAGFLDDGHVVEVGLEPQQRQTEAVLAAGLAVAAAAVAADLGEDRHHLVGEVDRQVLLTAILGVFFTALALIFREPLLIISGASGEIFDPALVYFTITAGGSILFFILITIMFAFNAQGDTFTLTKLFAVSTFVNGVLDPIMIFGWGIPAMGIAGAAYATLISQAVFIVIALYSLSRPQRHIQFHFKNLSFRWESVKRVLRIGVPAAMSQVINPVGIALLTYISFKAFAEAGVIAFSLGFRIEFFAYLPAVGYGFSAMAMIGQSMGAENLPRAREVLRLAMYYGCGIAFALGIIAAILARPIIAVFTEDPEVMGYGILYMRTVSLSYIFLAAMMVEASAFQALGRSWPGFWIFLLRFGVISIPLSYLLTMVLDFSMLGIWLALVAGNVISAVVGYFWIWSSMKKFDFKDIEKVTHMHG
ncbi:MATE family efflux transporter, partial [Candidatus Peregrinibacteria bacterium]|nr:MATE family efflux transporter [Candidatus Peregrinibacteria bacterium]